MKKRVELKLIMIKQKDYGQGVGRTEECLHGT